MSQVLYKPRLDQHRSAVRECLNVGGSPPSLSHMLVRSQRLASTRFDSAHPLLGELLSIDWDNNRVARAVNNQEARELRGSAGHLWYRARTAGHAAFHDRKRRRDAGRRAIRDPRVCRARCEEFWVHGEHVHRHCGARRKPRNEDARRIGIEFTRHRTCEFREKGRFAAAARLMAPLEPPPALSWIGGRRLFRIQHEEPQRIGRSTEPRPERDLPNVLRASVQHDYQRTPRGCAGGGDVHYIAKGGALGACELAGNIPLSSEVLSEHERERRDYWPNERFHKRTI